MIATDHHTLAYTHNENVYYMGQHTDRFTESVVNLNIREDDEVKENGDVEPVKLTEPEKFANKPQNMCYHWRILSSGNITYCSIEEPMKCPEFQDLSIAQRYLEEMLLIYHSLIKPFLKKAKLSSYILMYMKQFVIYLVTY